MTAAPLTPAEISELERLCSAATDEPWPEGQPPLYEGSISATEADLAFIAAARTALPRLLAEVKANKARCTKLEAVAEAAQAIIIEFQKATEMSPVGEAIIVGSFTVTPLKGFGWRELVKLRNALAALKEDEDVRSCARIRGRT